MRLCNSQLSIARSLVPAIARGILEHREIFKIGLTARKRLFACRERATGKRAADVGVHVDAGIDALDGEIHYLA